MVRKGLLVKNNKILEKVSRNYEKRQDLKKMVRNINLSPKERFAAQIKLDSRDKKESTTKHVNRCSITGKKTGFIRLFGVSRHVIRELAFKGYVPGLTKDSW